MQAASQISSSLFEGDNNEGACKLQFYHIVSACTSEDALLIHTRLQHYGSAEIMNTVHYKVRVKS